jgi:hypothetical protein
MLVGVVSEPIVTYLRMTPWFPWVKPEDKGKVLALSAAVNAALVVLVGVSMGTIDDVSIQSLAMALSDAVVAFTSGVATHEVTKGEES